MMITTNEGKRFEFGIFPDTGSTQAIIAEDIARDYDMIINKSWRRDIKNAMLQFLKNVVNGVSPYQRKNINLEKKSNLPDIF